MKPHRVVPAAEPKPTRKARDEMKPPQQNLCGGYSRLQEGTNEKRVALYGFLACRYWPRHTRAPTSDGLLPPVIGQDLDLISTAPETNVHGTILFGTVSAPERNRGRAETSQRMFRAFHAEGYEDITYQPRGRSWFVLSGHRGDQIYYEKAIFSRSGRVVNVLAIAYPEAERQRFDPVIERMEDSFKSGRHCG